MAQRHRDKGFAEAPQAPLEGTPTDFSGPVSTWADSIAKAADADARTVTLGLPSKLDVIEIHLVQSVLAAERYVLGRGSCAPTHD